MHLMHTTKGNTQNASQIHFFVARPTHFSHHNFGVLISRMLKSHIVHIANEWREGKWINENINEHTHSEDYIKYSFDYFLVYAVGFIAP